MDDLEKRLDDFFDAYAARFNTALKGEDADIDGTAAAFSECFIEASPAGVTCSKNDEKFRASISQGYNFYKSIGTRSMDILSKEVSVLDALHIMVKINWRGGYLKKNGHTMHIDFEVVYFIQNRENTLNIFAYITGDEEKVLKEKGLMPGPGH